MVSINGGTFQMGDTFDDDSTGGNEQPVHSVTVSSFLMGKYEVKTGEYLAFCQETNSNWPEWLNENSDYHVENGSYEYYKELGYRRNGSEDFPIMGVTWFNANAYCSWLSRKTGKNYRLPTEAEWEYAAREGGKKIRFGNGKDIADPAEMNFDSEIKSKSDYSVVGESREEATVVGSFSPNTLGLYDMGGNVWEWCNDWFGEYPKPAVTDIIPLKDPQGPATESNRSYRGGSWKSPPGFCRTTQRNGNEPTKRLNNLGFRLGLVCSMKCFCYSP